MAGGLYHARFRKKVKKVTAVISLLLSWRKYGSSFGFLFPSRWSGKSRKDWCFYHTFPKETTPLFPLRAALLSLSLQQNNPPGCVIKTWQQLTTNYFIIASPHWLGIHWSSKSFFFCHLSRCKKKKSRGGGTCANEFSQLLLFNV